ncbi:unnamed protein product [Musa textilis]
MVSEQLLFAFSPILNFVSLAQCTGPAECTFLLYGKFCTGVEFLARSSQTGDYQWTFLIEPCRNFHYLSYPRMLIRC